mgnify:FL=1
MTLVTPLRGCRASSFRFEFSSRGGGHSEGNTHTRQITTFSATFRPDNSLSRLYKHALSLSLLADGLLTVCLASLSISLSTLHRCWWNQPRRAGLRTRIRCSGERARRWTGMPSRRSSISLHLSVSGRSFKPRVGVPPPVPRRSAPSMWTRRRVPRRRLTRPSRWGRRASVGWLPRRVERAWKCVRRRGPSNSGRRRREWKEMARFLPLPQRDL